MPPKCKFQEGEKVLCYHGPLIYEAKCLKFSVTKEKQIKYYIHYAGWNKNWDEWVPESRVLKYNETNLQKKREVHQAHSNQQPAQRNKKSSTGSKGSGRRSDGGKEKDTDSRASTPVGSERTPGRMSRTPAGTPTPSSSEGSTEASRKKRSRLETTSDSDDYLAKVEFKIKMSEVLKGFLVDECEAVTKQNKFPKLPMRCTVDKILNDYVESKVGTDKVPQSANVREGALEVTKGIREYFNISLSLQLLYKCERTQYEQIVVNENPDSLPSQLYGPFHLLRLFVKLGGMLSYSTLDEKSIQLLLAHFQDFLQYMEKNSADLFNLQEDYVEVSS